MERYWNISPIQIAALTDKYTADTKLTDADIFSFAENNCMLKNVINTYSIYIYKICIEYLHKLYEIFRTSSIFMYHGLVLILFFNIELIQFKYRPF